MVARFTPILLQSKGKREDITNNNNNRIRNSNFLYFLEMLSLVPFIIFIIEIISIFDHYLHLYSVVQLKN